MNALDNDWFSFGGDARPGRVPPRVIVKGPQGYELTASQRGQLNQVFRQFTTSVRTSPIPDGLHTKRMRLGDGSRIEMVASNGVYQTTVYPAVNGGAPHELLTGLLFVPARVTWEYAPGGWRSWLSYAPDTYVAPGYAAKKAPPALAAPPSTRGAPDEVRKLYPTTKIQRTPGPRYWQGGAEFNNLRLRWRGAPRKYLPFRDYVARIALVATGHINPAGWVDDPAAYLSQASKFLWIGQGRRETGVAYIFSACLHRPQDSGGPGNIFVRVFGIRSDASPGFSVCDLVPEGVAPELSTLEALMSAPRLVVHTEYVLPSDYDTGGLSADPEDGKWKFLWAPEFNSTGSKMAAAIARKESGSIHPYELVCEMDPTNFTATGEQQSFTYSVNSGTVGTGWHEDGGYMSLVSSGDTSSGSWGSKQYVACDYADGEFVTMWVETDGSSSGSSSFSWTWGDPGSAAWSSTGGFSETTTVHHSTLGDLYSHGAATTSSGSQTLASGTFTNSGSQATSLEFTADLAIGFIHLGALESSRPGTSLTSSGSEDVAAFTTTFTYVGRIFFGGETLAIATWARGRSDEVRYTFSASWVMGFAQTIETRDFTESMRGGPYLLSSYDGADIYTARCVHDYRICAVTKDRAGVYLGAGVLNDPRTDIVDPPTQPPTTYESLFLRKEQTGVQAWPAPVWWDENTTGENRMHLGAVFI